MKAWYITQAGQMTVRDIPDPQLAPGEVLLQVKRVGYCGSDLNTYRGANPLVSLPRIPGHEIGAVIAAVGSAVPKEHRVGDVSTLLPYTTCGICSACRQQRTNACRNNQTLGVQRDGGLTEFLAAPWESLVRSVKLTVTEHTLIEPLSVGFHAVQRGRVTIRDTVLVIGCGMIGLGAISGAALLQGARVIAVDVDDGKLALARKAGASAVINSRTQNLPDQVRELTVGDGPSVVIEAVGHPATFRAAVDVAAFAARVVYIGYAKEPVSYETKYFVMKELDILGSRNATRENFEDVRQVLESGRIPVSEIITRTVPFSAAGAALADWAADPSQVTKVHIEI